MIDPGDAGNYQPRLDPDDFVDAIDNPYLPLEPGARWVYEGIVDGEHNRIELEVTTERKEILGISAVGVSDTNYVDGELAAETRDWYAPDRKGNVWYVPSAPPTRAMPGPHRPTGPGTVRVHRASGVAGV